MTMHAPKAEAVAAGMGMGMPLHPIPTVAGSNGNWLGKQCGSMPEPGVAFPPCPPGVEPHMYAQQMHTAAAAAAAAAQGAAAGGGASNASSEFVSRFYAVLQNAVEQQQQQLQQQQQQSSFMRVGADATSAERRAEAIKRYLKKRKDRNFEKKVRYVSRKHLAEARPRVRGQFVRLKEGEDAAVGGEDDVDKGDGEGEGCGGEGCEEGMGGGG